MLPVSRLAQPEVMGFMLLQTFLYVSEDYLL